MGTSWRVKPAEEEGELKVVVELVGESTRFVVVEGMALSRTASRSFSRGWWSCSGRLGMADMVAVGEIGCATRAIHKFFFQKGGKRWDVRYRGQEDQKCRNENPYKAYTAMIRSYILYVRKTETGTTCGAHHRPCSSRSPNSALLGPPHQQVESTHRKSGSFRGVDDLNCRGVSLTSPRQKGNKHKTQEITHATRLRDSMRKVDPSTRKTCGVRKKWGKPLYGDGS